jgi:serine/threonine protein phosphatase PrpC
MGNPDSSAPSPGDAVHVEIAGITDVGRIRDHNEDAFLIAGLGEKAVDRSEEGYRGPLPGAGLLFAVADGMGGAASGEVASRMAVETIRDQLRDGYAAEAEPEVLQRGLEGALDTANEKIYAVANQDAKHRGMGTTMTAVLASGGRLCFSQIGDSRAYLLRKNELVQLTKDQSLINQLIEDGTLTEEEAEKIGGRNIILQALGVEESINTDTRHLELLDDDVILVCSDGLSGMVPDPELRKTLAAQADPAKACRTLVDQANAVGGRDNISVIVARFQGGPLRPPTEVGELPVVREGAAREKKPAPPWRLPAILLAAAAAVGLLAVLLLAGGESPLFLELDVDGASGEVLAKADRAPVAKFAAGPGDRMIRVDGLDPGEYLVVVRRPGYEEVELGVPLPAGGSRVRIELTARSGKIHVVPSVKDAVVELSRRSGDAESIVYTGEAAVTFLRAPGSYSLIVRRPGYVDHRATLELAAGQELPVEVNLAENLGLLIVRGAVDGTTVVIRDEEGREEERELGDGKFRLREGNYELTFKADRYEDERQTKFVRGGGEPTPCEISQRPKRGTLLVKVGPRTRELATTIKVRWKKDDGTDDSTGRRIPDPEEGAEVSEVSIPLPAREYEIEVGTAERREVTLVAGKTTTVVYE